MGKKITIHSPATVANMVCGFDVLGFAVQEPYDIMQIEFAEAPGIVIVNEDDFNLPTDPLQNGCRCCFTCITMEAFGQPVGFKLTINKQIKPGSGVGSVRPVLLVQ